MFSSVLRFTAQFLEQRLCNTSQTLCWPYTFQAKPANKRQRGVWDVIGVVRIALAHQAPSPGAEPHRHSQLLVAGSFAAPQQVMAQGWGLFRDSRSTGRHKWREGSSSCLRGLSGRQATEGDRPVSWDREIQNWCCKFSFLCIRHLNRCLDTIRIILSQTKVPGNSS